MRQLILSALLLGLIAAPLGSQAAPGMVDPLTLSRIRDSAMQDEWGYLHLAELTDQIGPRLAGSAGLAAAIERMASALRDVGAKVSLQPTTVPHWERGIELAELVDFKGRSPGTSQQLHLVALGASGSTPAIGVTAPIIVVHSFDELSERAGEAKGRIVVFNIPFDQRLADNGFAGQAYGQAGQQRFMGPSVASKVGALATLVRSVGDAAYRLPHTGATEWEPGQTPMPAAALSAEDADLLDRLSTNGPVSIHMTLTPRRGPDVDSANVLADWVGREHPDEVVVVSGHLDSWDLGTGAVDDGAGVMAAAGVIETLSRLGIHPRRTIRFVAFTDEELSGRGAEAYATAASHSSEKTVAAIECDLGAGRALGVQASVTPESMNILKGVSQALAPIGASILVRREGALGADIRSLQLAGAPGFSPVLDARHYFDYHHTAADTLDKVNPENLRSEVATLAVLAYYLAELPDPLPRVPVAGKD
jgi:hypothetical protein